MRSANEFRLFVPRLLLMLALVDTFHLVSSALTFSIANLSPAYSGHAWYYVVPYSLPVAQVSTFSCLERFFWQRKKLKKMLMSVYSPVCWF